MQNILQTIISLLPRYPEEGSAASRINETELLAVLMDNFTSDQAQTIATTLDMVKNLLTSLSLLDDEALQLGAWKFISHPAQLCALSLLHTLADSRQKLFASSFWQTAGVGDHEKQQQKTVLEALENHQQAQHVDNNAVPIRFVYVAWGILKLNNKILFHQREASEHVHEYGLIGGRANLYDLKRVMGEDTPTQKLLTVLQSPHSAPVSKALEYTLQRELEEEVGLIATADHYSVKLWHELKPWQNCMGAAPNYALSQYFFRLYHIELTTTGYLTLRRSLQKHANRFIECTIGEIVTGKTSNGANTLTIKALYDNFADNHQALTQALEKLPSSYQHNYTCNNADASLILSLHHPISYGDSGKEKPLPMKFTPEQQSLLLGMAAHAKGLLLQPKQKITLHPYGWVEIHDSTLQQAATQLSEYCRNYAMPYLEIAYSHYFRLSLAPEYIFFHPEFFSYDLQELDNNTWQIRFQRQALLTAVGDIPVDAKTVPLTAMLATLLRKVGSETNNSLAVSNNEDLPKKVRSALQNHYQALGLKRFLIAKHKSYMFACNHA